MNARIDEAAVGAGRAPGGRAAALQRLGVVRRRAAASCAARPADWAEQLAGAHPRAGHGHLHPGHRRPRRRAPLRRGGRAGGARPRGHRARAARRAGPSRPQRRMPCRRLPRRLRRPRHAETLRAERLCRSAIRRRRSRRRADARRRHAAHRHPAVGRGEPADLPGAARPGGAGGLRRRPSSRCRSTSSRCTTTCAAELAQVRDVVEQVVRGHLAVGSARSAVNAMTMRQNNWTLGAYCESYCRVVTGHHTLEDTGDLPAPARAATPTRSPSSTGSRRSTR